MSEEIKIMPKLTLKIERARARAYRRGAKQYARVQKFVPDDWLGKEVVIMTSEDFDRLLKFIDRLLYLLDTALSKRAKS